MNSNLLRLTRFKVRHLIVVLVLLMVVFSLSYLMAVNSEPYNVGVLYVRSDQDVYKDFGVIKGVSLDVFEGYNISSYSARYSLKVAGGAKSGIVQLALKKGADGWYVVSIVVLP